MPYYRTVSSYPDPNDQLAIPAFLDRRQYIEEDGEILVVLTDFKLPDHNAPRQWAPIRRIEDIKKEETAPQIWVDDRNDPVQVVSTKRENLQRYDNFDDFMKFHDFEDFPVKVVKCAAGVSYIIVRAQIAITQLSDKLRDIEQVKPDVIEQNGVKRPKTNSITGIAWTTFDKMHANGTDFKIIFEDLKKNGMNPSTIRTQFAHWRKFNGITK